MAIERSRDGSLLVRGAVAVGRTLGQWRRNRVAAAQDAYVEAWQAAWMEGSSAGWAGEPLSALPYQRPPQRDAWAAGWNWAQTQPDRRHPRGNLDVPLHRGENTERRRALVSAAKGGALSLTVVAAARWFMRRRNGAPRLTAPTPPQNPPPLPGQSGRPARPQ